jgi:hypothetical protein
MATIDDYVLRVEGTCGAEKDVIVTFKFDKKDEAIRHMRERAALKNNLAGIIFELTFEEHTFRLYATGKAIFRSIKNREELNALLAKLLL